MNSTHGDAVTTKNYSFFSETFDGFRLPAFDLSKPVEYWFNVRDLSQPVFPQQLIVPMPEGDLSNDHPWTRCRVMVSIVGLKGEAWRSHELVLAEWGGGSSHEGDKLTTSFFVFPDDRRGFDITKQHPEKSYAVHVKITAGSGRVGDTAYLWALYSRQ